MAEEWRQIEGYPRYEVSNFGHVRNVLTNRILKNSREKRGYLTVMLYPERKTHMVHLLVIRNFVGICPEGQECRHLDGNPSNSQLSNLRYGTRSQNYFDAYEHGTRSKEKDNLIGQKARDTRDKRYGRENWTKLWRAGVAYSKADLT